MTQSPSDLFYSLAKALEEEECHAFFVNSLNDYEIAAGAKRICTIDNSLGAFEKLRAFQEDSQDRIAGFLSYDLKNDLEDLESSNPDELNFPEAVFFEPKCRIRVKDGNISHVSGDSGFFQELISKREIISPQGIDFQDIPLTTAKTSELEYIQGVKELHAHLQRGDIYEANYCIQYLAKDAKIEPVGTFLSLYALTEAPMSVFSKVGEHYILSASPERFLKNQGGRLLSQPIKGTRKRSEDNSIDESLKLELFNDLKEQSENVMIVDLVRNDLSRVAKRGSVQVEKLFGVETFKTVHHLVSSITCQLETSRFNHWDAISACFPMGSMTGAPKIAALKIIDRLENFKRGAYSGAFGWIDPNGDFDFNVLIRTLLYNRETKILGFSVGSAITIKAEAEKEYDECDLKARALLSSLKNTNNGKLVDQSV